MQESPILCYFPGMISVKEAVAKATNFAATMLEPPRNSDLRLEEVEAGQQNGDGVWLITLSMPSPTLLPLPLQGSREFKTFTVHRMSGEVLAMKIRELASSQ